MNSLREIQALRRLSPHPNIIILQDVLFDKLTGKLALVFELMHANLYDVIRGDTLLLSYCGSLTLCLSFPNDRAHIAVLFRFVSREGPAVHCSDCPRLCTSNYDLYWIYSQSRSIPSRYQGSFGLCSKILAQIALLITISTALTFYFSWLSSLKIFLSMEQENT